MLGAAAVAMWWDIASNMKPEFEDWHSREHMPERLAIPGFLRGCRWIAASGEPSYFVLYEVASMATLTSGPYLERLNDPTPWSRKMMPHHRNMVRSLCLVRATFGRGLAHAVATVRLNRELSAEALPPLTRHKGITGAHLLQSQPMVGMPQTTEQKIRGGDAEASRIALICGYDGEALGAAARELAAGAPAGLYRLSYCLTCGDLG
jgi:hypothetical protein